MPARDVAKAKALIKEAGVTPPVSVDFMVPKGPETASGRRSDPGDGGGSRLRHEDPRDRIRDLAQAGRSRRISRPICSPGAAAPIRTATSISSCKPRRRRTTAAGRNPEADKALDEARLVSDPAQRKAIYEKLTKILLEEEPILYLYHRRILIAHTTKLEGYKQMPDGLVRVVGLKLK